VKEKPTKALPIPRAYDIRRTIHAERRAFSPRKIPLEMIDETIRTGRAYFEGEKGRLNGDIFKFTKSYIVVEGTHRRTKSVVAVCEIVGKVCHVITTYNE
jgi:hypothetical protein